MASLVEWCAGVGSALASLLIFWWSTIDNFANPIFRLTAWVSRIVFFFSPYLQLTISEYGAERFERSEFFLAVEAYLSEACADRARKITAEIGRNSKNVQVYVDDHEEVADTYHGATIWWRASKKKPTSVISFIPGEETRLYHVVFHRRHHDLVICDYLPYVLNKGRSATIQNRPRRLFTNKPSSRWRPYDAKNASWSHVAFHHPATFQTLAMDPDEKEAIIDDLTSFHESRDYYSKVGKPWKRGYLLYGPPGTGKSTMIAAMSNFLDYDIYDLELIAVKNNTELRKLFIETTSRSIIVIEDIDCSVDLTGKRKDKKKKKKKKPDDDTALLPVESDTEEESNKLTLSGVLNFIDGLWSACGGERIIIFTTNNKDKLDPALIRRGRMDRHIEMSYCRFEAFKLLAKNFLDVEEHECKELFGEIRRLLEQTDMSPADVAENLMPMSRRKNKRDPATCLKGLVKALKKANEEAANKALVENVDADAVVKPTEEEEEEEGRCRHRREAEHGKDDRVKMDQPAAQTPKMETLSSLVRPRDSKEWVLDTSSLIHYTFNLRLLHDLKTHRDDDHELSAVLDRGSVKTERFKVPDVHYIQGEATNVISVAQLARRHGLVTVFEPTCAYVRDGATGQDVGRAHLSNGIYVLDYLLIQQLKKGGVQVEGKGPARGSHGGGSGLGRVGDDERKGSGGGSGGTRHGQDEGKDRERGEDDGRAGDEDGDGKVEELQQVGMFGQPRSNRCGAKEEGSPQEKVDGTRTVEFYVVSGAQHHITWNEDVLRRYHGALQIKPPVDSVITTSPLKNTTTLEPQPAKVCGIGYIDSKGGSLDSVLFVPDSAVNLISVSQLTEDSSVRVVFKEDEFWIEKLQTDERIGFGRRVGTGYVVARLDVGAACDWILDTFAPYHYTPHKWLLYIHTEEEASDLPLPPPVAAARDKLQVVVHGSLESERYNIPNVHYTASADNEESSSVISVAQLVKKHGLVTVFEPTCCHVKEKETGRIVGRGRLRRGVYVMDYLLISQQYKLEGEVGGRVHDDASGKDKGKRHEGGSGDGGKGRKGNSRSSGGGQGGSGEKSRHVGGCEGDRKEGKKEEQQQKHGDEGGDRDGEDGDREGGEGEGEGGGEGGEEEEGEEEGEGEEEDGEIEEEGNTGQGEDIPHFLFGQSQDDMDIDGSFLLLEAFPERRRNDEAPKSEFILASKAARYHVTWNRSVLFPYPPRLHDSSRPPIHSFVGAMHSGVGPITVTNSGYLNGDKIMLDGVLLAPDSQMNLVSVVQLGKQYGVRVEIHEDIRIIKELGNGEQVQFGRGYMNESLQSVLEFFKPQPEYLYAHSPDHNHYFYHENFFAPHQRL